VRGEWRGRRGRRGCAGDRAEGEEGDDAGVDGTSATEEEGVGEAAPAGERRWEEGDGAGRI
jgi:hypothetical protein